MRQLTVCILAHVAVAAQPLTLEELASKEGAPFPDLTLTGGTRLAPDGLRFLHIQQGVAI
jgi:hypothetical protein